MAIPTPVSYYKLDANSNDSVASNNGTDTSISYVAWKINNAASFNGSSSFIDIWTGFNSILNQSTWSISLWSNLTTWSGTYGSKYIANDNSSWQRQFDIFLNTSWTVGIEMYSSPNVQVNSTLTVPSGWYNLVVIYGSSTIKVYVNGTEYINTAMNVLPTTTNNTNIGRREYPSFEWYFWWLIDEVGIWSSTLSSQDITDLYNWGSWVSYPFPSWGTNNTNFLLFF